MEHWLIETIVVFEFPYLPHISKILVPINRNNSCIWIRLSFPAVDKMYGLIETIVVFELEFKDGGIF